MLAIEAFSVGGQLDLLSLLEDHQRTDWHWVERTLRKPVVIKLVVMKWTKVDR